jgi:integral membrane sensor domain MASE1
MGEQRWVASVGLAAAVGVLYYLVAYLSLTGLLFYQSEGVTVFWAAAGISSGLLISLGSRARWPVLAGVFVAAFLIPLVLLRRGIWLATIFALCDVVEPIIIAGLIARYFSGDFALDQLRKVFGLLGATIAGTAPSSLGGAIASRLFLGPEVQILTTWLHWWTGVAVGVVTVAPVIIGFSAVMRAPAPRSEQIEGAAGLLALAAMTGVVLSLPQQLCRERCCFPYCCGSLPIVDRSSPPRECWWFPSRSHFHIKARPVAGCRTPRPTPWRATNGRSPPHRGSATGSGQ